VTFRLTTLALVALAIESPSRDATAQIPVSGTFDSQKPPPVPDYAKAASWAARPGHEGAASAVAPGATPPARYPAVDVFYVNPTTYRSKTVWNQDIADTEANGWTDASVMARQASAFSGCCRIYAPRYRQASAGSFALMNGDGAKAYDLAYGDVARAFAYYLEHDNRGRPFILVGHSQGGYHIARLIEEKIDGTPLARRMVAAYVIGYNLSEGDFGKTYKTVRVCATPAQTGCIVQWNSVLSTVDIALAATRGEDRYVKRYGDDPRKTMLCINPLTFDRNRPMAATDNSKGAMPGNPGYGPLLALRPNSVAARCENGLLIVEPSGGLGLTPIPGGSMHYHDVGLFYADIRANAIARSNVYLKQSQHRRPDRSGH
jgi:Protein of unknown function (DUF3089)